MNSREIYPEKLFAIVFHLFLKDESLDFTWPPDFFTMKWRIDEILITGINRSISIITEPLAHIINKSFKNGVFPKSLKMDIVRPLFKKENDPSNYKPISLLTSFSKITLKKSHDS